MIPMKTSITESGPTPRKLAKEIKRINLYSARKLGEHFHAVNLPRRFTIAGGRMLGFALRSPDYQRMKLRRKGHNNPLEFSGRTKRDVLGIEDVRTSGTSKRWTAQVVLRARGLNRFKTSRINPAEEIRRVAAKEEGPLARVFENHFDQQTQAIK